jgi:hypothetical protein
MVEVACASGVVPCVVHCTDFDPSTRGEGDEEESKTREHDSQVDSHSFIHLGRTTWLPLVVQRSLTPRKHMTRTRPCLRLRRYTRT